MATKTRQPPRQARALATFEKLIEATQELLEESGLEALTSNAVVERAGLTPPAFYRYFPNKHALLEELGQRLMDVQNEVIINLPADGPLTKKRFIDASKTTLRKTVDVTRKFHGGYALLVSLRAVPELRHVRLTSHDKMAKELATLAMGFGITMPKTELLAKSRLAIEMGYAMLEMLYETNFKDKSIVLEATAEAQAAIFGFDE